MSGVNAVNNLTFKYEDGILSADENAVVCGVDEAGRGPLAGRVYAAAVILPRHGVEELISLIADSKKLSPKKRETLAERIRREATAYSVAYAEVEEIEEINILEASLLAMRRAISTLPTPPTHALIDGNIERDFDKVGVTASAVVGGDALSPSIAAASILAKTERDRYCAETLAVLYPEYGFEKHKGYGTAAHYRAVDEHGLCPAHRKSFFTKYFAKKGKRS